VGDHCIATGGRPTSSSKEFALKVPLTGQNLQHQDSRALDLFSALQLKYLARCSKLYRSENLLVAAAEVLNGKCQKHGKAVPVRC
jgi:hypothetical protein